jgi:type 1 glutamine amidotransferase
MAFRVLLMKSVLLFHGGWAGHEPAECAALFTAELGARGFAVESTDSLACLDDAARLTSFDLIVPLWTMGALTKEQEANLVAAVTAGTGLAGFHGGMGDAFRGSINYQWMVGGIWAAHPDNVKPYRVNINAAGRADPILAGFDDFDVVSEQYYMLVDPLNEVLATTTLKSVSAPWTDGVVMPVVWKKMHGAGRVFYSALGHKAQEFRDVPQQLELTLRGMEWATR